MGQYLGRMGESFFNTLCASMGITCNPAQEDMAGWDFILDFPCETILVASSDTSPPPIECKVQIKSTNKSRKNVSITLSNLLRFAKSPLPSFFVFIEYNNTSFPEAIYVVHFDNFMIEQTLKKVREIEQGSKTKKLNKSTIKISYDDSHALSSICGVDFKERIESFIPNGLSDYSAKKIKSCREVGFDTETGIMTFNTFGEDSLIAMIEASLGKNREIPVSNIVINEKRFGIPLKNPILTQPEGLLKFSQCDNYIDVKIHFYINKYSSKLSFDAKLYLSPLSPFLPKKYTRVRLQTDFFDAMLNLSGGQGSYNFSFKNTSFKLRELLDRVKLLIWACFPDEQLCSDIISLTNKNKKVHFKWNETNNLVRPEEGDWKEHYSYINNAYELAKKFELENSILVTLDEINSRQEEIDNLHKIYNCELDEIRLKFNPTKEYKKEFLGKLHCIIYAIPMHLSDALMVTVFSFFGYIENIKSEPYEIKLTERRVEYELSTTSHDEDFIQYIEMKVKKLIEKYTAMQCVIIKTGEE